MYRLLTFNRDWADEHNVPALACFNQEEYDKWYASPKGGANREYEEEMNEYQAKLVEYNAYMQMRKDAGPLSKNMSEWTPLQRQLMNRSVSRPYNPPKKAFSWLTAYLGNSGDSFNEDYHNHLTAQDYIDSGYVRVTEVDESFYNYFHKARLGSLSMCNIFDLEMEEIDW